ncbi:DUF2950 domain-containing protein [Ramlibacter tataouinensis]|uniref:DUF2950 domain-containing protein n=1 Tax=Ramlibacter tataouinensis TaxID=94132 RepID=A0A127JZW8_9BURK|nr:DUF2950 domain-containing protein [Ramlibacter tataouinensis]AMO25469.1 hypothetical protein UC35_14715 [Ramlibacter tataouinensis]
MNRKSLILDSMLAVALALAPGWALAQQSAEGQKAASAPKAQAPKPAPPPKSYPSAEAAAAAFTDALRKNDRVALGVVLGQNWRRYVPAEGGPDREDVDAYLADWDKAHKIVNESDSKAVISVGEGGWTLPVPIVKVKSGWRFDPAAGADEMRVRAIGRNELNAMQAALAYVDAQRDYASKDRDKTGVRYYAQKFASTPGKHDGLYWDDPTGKDESPLGPVFAGNKPTGGGYHGYHFRILTGQGKQVPGGAYSYISGGRLRNGFGLIAWPVKYGETGVMSFMLNHEGKLLEKDLGPNTATVAGQMKTFNPDAGWKPAPTQAASK